MNFKFWAVKRPSLIHSNSSWELSIKLSLRLGIYFLVAMKQLTYLQPDALMKKTNQNKTKNYVLCMYVKKKKKTIYLPTLFDGLSVGMLFNCLIVSIIHQKLEFIILLGEGYWRLLVSRLISSVNARPSGSNFKL